MTVSYAGFSIETACGAVGSRAPGGVLDGMLDLCGSGPMPCRNGPYCRLPARVREPDRSPPRGISKPLARQKVHSKTPTRGSRTVLRRLRGPKMYRAILARHFGAREGDDGVAPHLTRYEITLPVAEFR